MIRLLKKWYEREAILLAQAYDGYNPSHDKISVQEAELAAMKPRESNPSWEERGLALWHEFVHEWRENPVNMTGMVIFCLAVLGAVLYGASYIAPTLDPSYH